jgi:hypothetical protein
LAAWNYHVPGVFEQGGNGIIGDGACGIEKQKEDESGQLKPNIGKPGIDYEMLGKIYNQND